MEGSPKRYVPFWMEKIHSNLVYNSQVLQIFKPGSLGLPILASLLACTPTPYFCKPKSINLSLFGADCFVTPRPTIVAGLGYSGGAAQLHTVPPYVPAVVLTSM